VGFPLADKSGPTGVPYLFTIPQVFRYSSLSALRSFAYNNSYTLLWAHIRQRGANWCMIVSWFTNS
jgi:hypothetical protein